MPTELDSLDPKLAAPGIYRVLTESGSEYTIALYTTGMWTLQRRPTHDAEPQWVDDLTVLRGLPKIQVGQRPTFWRFGAGYDDDLWVRASAVCSITRE